MTIEEDPEYTMTKTEWQDTQLRFEVTSEGLQALTEEETAALQAERIRTDQEAVQAALVALLKRHPVEFEGLLRVERQNRLLRGEVPTTGLASYVEFLGISA